MKEIIVMASVAGGISVLACAWYAWTAYSMAEIVGSAVNGRGDSNG